ncbi:non-ribosomal peptide synthetase [Aquimarina sp. I32.4]|uniref:non-ribosomal peptide synthetase n=1 Tax=Aquimarina sp. I32.4 TaxID=2053903 RepID=UPI000CDF0D08|nr:non-ribosomal peptide synthetase [Aquimarina sp. I32.4]
MKFDNIIDLFRENVNNNGDELAIVSSTVSYTYEELDQKTNTLSGYLQYFGSDTREELCFVFTTSSLVASQSLLGVFKSGKIFVPISLDFPDKNIEALLEEYKPQWIILDQLSKDRFEKVRKNVKQCKFKVCFFDLTFYNDLKLNEEDIFISNKNKIEKDQIYPIELNSLDPCYIYFTSGSTNKAKAILGAFKGINHFINWEINFLNPKNKLKVSQLTSHTFDAFLRDLFLPLCSGGTLYIPPKIEGMIHVDQLVDWINDNEINIVHCVPSLFRELLDSYHDQKLNKLEYILLSGESLYQEDIKNWYHIFGNKVSLINLYGASETTMVKFSYTIDFMLDQKRPIAIGKPITECKAILLDANLMPVKQGNTGELYIRTEYGSLGYYKNKGLTEKNFIEHPLLKGIDKLLYKTGDIAFVREDGNYIFKGRKDYQVKINGVRVELDEVESTIIQYPGIEDCVVFYSKETNKLVTSLKTKEQIVEDELKYFLKQHLPISLIPVSYSYKKVFPKNSNGKTDRKQLLEELKTVTKNKNADHVTPENEIQIDLVHIWKKLLKIEKVGIHNDFFDLGGNSLLVVRLVSLIRKQFSVEISIKEIFELPTIFSLSKSIEADKNNKSILPEIEVYSRPSLIPLSFAQERLWFLDKLTGSVNYHIPIVLKIQGELNFSQIESSLEDIIDRHEILRTIYEEINGKLYQKILNKESKLSEIQKLNLSRKDVLKDLINDEISKPFDLSKDLPIRIKLIEITPNEYILIMVVHHIASDGWSMNLLINEFSELYKSKIKNYLPKLDKLSIQYADYVLWQNSYLNEDLLEHQLQYWENKLQNVEPLNLPTDFKRPSLQSNKGNTLNFSIDKLLENKLKKLALKEDTTLFMILLSVFKILLYRYSGQDDICVGSPIANRTRLEVEPLIGCFINTLALRSNLSNNPSYKSFLTQIKNTTLEAYKYQDVPFEKIVDRVVKSRDLSRNPIFDVMFVLQNNEVFEETDMENITFSNEHFSQETTQFDLTFNLTETSNGIDIGVTYCSELFLQTTIEQMMEHYKQLLSSIVENPKMQIGNISMLSKKEEEQLTNFSKTDKLFPYKDATIIDLFEEQVANNPKSVALVFEEKEYTYDALNRLSNQLGSYLREKYTIKSDDLIGIRIERSEWLIIGILGILKSGGAYVPIDSEFPEDRCNYIIEDSGCKTILDESEIEIFLSECDSYPEYNSKNLVSSKNLAYVIYTSGSTGKPKGVLIEHYSLLDYVTTFNDKFDLIEDDRVIHQSSISFDTHIEEIFPCLIAGGCLLVSRNGGKDIFETVKLIENQKATILSTTPLFLKELNLIFADYTSLRLIISGGDILKTEYINNSLANIKVCNTYGPTETTVIATIYDIQKREGTIPIGKPYGTNEIYILDKNQELVPVGVIGQLCISGKGVARGYQNKPELTSEKFINNPIYRESEAKLYCTGDLAFWLPDGNIEFVGRTDDQVKIRGYRIELNEIEAVLQKSTLVNQCAIVVKEDFDETKRLIAYIVPEKNYDKEKIRGFMQSQLPNYMIPSLLITIEKLPLNTSNKIDRKFLSDLDTSEVFSNSYIAPTNFVQSRLVKIWEEVLNIEKVGIEDDFFELGGHSLLVIRVVSKIRNEFNKEISIKDVFSKSTISALSKIITSYKEKDVLPEISSYEDRSPHIPLSFSQEQIWLIDKLEGSLHYHMYSTICLEGILNIDIIERSFKEIINRHEVLRTIFIEKNGVANQLVLEKDNWEGLKYIDNSNGIDPNIFIKREINIPFNLSSDHMLRISLIKISEVKHILVLVVHHIASDGWSIPIVIKEFLSFYNFFKGKNTIVLPELPIQYADYSIWQRNYLNEEVLENKLSYWKNKLSGVSFLNLPTDKERPPVQSNRGNTSSFNIDSTIRFQLESLSQSCKSTLFTTLLSVFKVLLYRHSGQEDICVGSPVSNRNNSKLESSIGYFVNTLPLRTDLSGNPSFKDLLLRVKEVVLESFDYQDVPFEKIVKTVQQERDLSRTPLFQVLFVLDMEEISLQTESLLSDLEMSEQVFCNQISKFDLTFNVVQSSDKLEVKVEYCSDLFLPETIERMMAHYNELLCSIVSDLTTPINDLKMLTPPEVQTLVLDFNNTDVIYPRDKTVIELFEDQTKKTPESIALTFDGSSLTYKELDDRANQLANYLRKKNSKEESIVAICLDRSFDIVIALLGIFKSGAAYVPFDPNSPQERLDYMMSDTNTKLILTNKEYNSRFVSYSNLEILLVDDNITVLQEPTTTPSRDLKGVNLSYVIYTSGSTGKPKGVMLTHESLRSRILSEVDILNLDQNVKTCFLTNYVFEISLLELILPLVIGGSILIPTDNQINSPTSLIKLMDKEGVTLIQGTPSYLISLINVLEEDNTKLEALDRICFGGESLSQSLVTDIHRKLRDVKVNNHYGPTETTIDAIFYENIISFESNIIGKPMPNTKVYIVDLFNKLVPIGVSGQILIGGDGLARGYLNLPDLTDDKFIPNPFSEKKNQSKLYKTGDLGRWLPDGNIEFIGRIDDQVKIRGNRVELGEIESILLESPLINQSVVLLTEDQYENNRLIAYVVPENFYDKILVIEYLKTKLPSYMIPSILIELDELPLTVNGKVDKKLLPNFDDTLITSNNYVAPRNEIEKKLVEVWVELLKVHKIGVYDNYFELGGDSIISIQVVSRLKEFNYNLKPLDLFQSPTISTLAKKVKLSSELCKSEQGILIGKSLFSPIQKWFFETDYVEVSHFNQEVLIETDKDLVDSFYEKTFRALIEHHDALRFSYKIIDGKRHQNYEEYKDSLEIIDLSHFNSTNVLYEEITKLCEGYQKSLNIENGEIIKVVLIKTPSFEIKNRLFIVVHHLAIDGVSWRIIFDDIRKSLTALSSGETIDFGEKSSSYREWIEILQDHVTTRQIELQQKYWKRTIEDYIPLPTDKNSGTPTMKSVQRVSVSLSPSSTNDLLKQTNQAYSTQINDILLSALAKTISDWSKNLNTIICLEGHGREHISEKINITNTVGWFTSLYPIKLTLEKGISEGNLVKSVKEQLRAIPKKGIGYGLLRYMHPSEDMRKSLHGDKWDIVFNYLGQYDVVSNNNLDLEGAKELTGNNIGENYPFTNKLEIDSSISQGKLDLLWSYSTNQYDHKTIKELASQYIINLEEIITHCVNKRTKEYTPSDYGLNHEIDYKELNDFGHFLKSNEEEGEDILKF